MHLEKVYFHSTNKLAGNLFIPNKNVRKGLLFLHGGGTSTKERFAYLQEELAEHGYASFAIDFRGCGESEGSFKDGSLQHRLDDAEAAYDYFQQYVDSITVVGSSMGGHVASRLIQTKKADKLILLYPAAYALEAEDKPLNDTFTKVLREEGSWKNSPIFPALMQYDNPVLIIYGENDTVVPKEVQEKYREIAKIKGKSVILPNAPHLILTRSKEQTFHEILTFLND